MWKSRHSCAQKTSRHFFFRDVPNDISTISKKFSGKISIADSLSSKIIDGKFLKRALHYPFNWIRFLEINKLCNVIAENFTFSTNRKLISISWKVWTCSNFSTNWKWKWINRIRHGRKNLVGKQKFELIWKIIYLYKSNQFACY